MGRASLQFPIQFPTQNNFTPQILGATLPAHGLLLGTLSFFPCHRDKQTPRDRSGTWQRTEKLQRKSRSVSHLFTQQQSTSMTTSWHLYLVARFSRVSTSSTRRTYSCSTCERQKVSAPFHRYVLPHSFTPLPKPFKVADHTDLAPSLGDK